MMFRPLPHLVFSGPIFRPSPRKIEPLHDEDPYQPTPALFDPRRTQNDRLPRPQSVVVRGVPPSRKNLYSSDQFCASILENHQTVDFSNSPLHFFVAGGGSIIPIGRAVSVDRSSLISAVDLSRLLVDLDPDSKRLRLCNRTTTSPSSGTKTMSGRFPLMSPVGRRSHQVHVLRAQKLRSALGKGSVVKDQDIESRVGGNHVGGGDQHN